MRPRDFLLLAVYCSLLWVVPLLVGRTFTVHETIGCVNIREMRADGDWVVPHYGGRPWLERPPLPFWLTQPILRVFGDVPLAYRLPPALVALGCVLLVGWMASVWYGRGVGLLAGLVFATGREFLHYSTAPECDVFLCGMVTLAMALFVHLEFRRRPATDETGFLFAKRPWPVLAFFVVLGLANLVKGLFFGDLMILLPVAAFLLIGSDRWRLVRRYVWLPGWVAFAVAASAWAGAAYLRYPDIVDLWKSDYVGRYNQGYMREPIWYYLVHLPWVLFPWTIAAAIGLGCTWRRALAEGRTPERFLWCWAIVPLVAFSVPQGKHHHYLLHLLAPWAVLAALGTARAWQWLVESGWWVARRLEPRWAVVVLFGLFVPAYGTVYHLTTLFEGRYEGDCAFVEQVREQVPGGTKLLVLDACGPLDASWMLYHLPGRAELLHNATYLRDERHGDDVYLVTRRFHVPTLGALGAHQLLFESARSRDEHKSLGTQARYGLYRVQLHPWLARCSEPLYVSPMQATGRAPGPEMTGASGIAGR